jgi:hypothetical protein
MAGGWTTARGDSRRPSGKKKRRRRAGNPHTRVFKKEADGTGAYCFRLAINSVKPFRKLKEHIERKLEKEDPKATMTCVNTGKGRHLRKWIVVRHLFPADRDGPPLTSIGSEAVIVRKWFEPTPHQLQQQQQQPKAEQPQAQSKDTYASKLMTSANANKKKNKNKKKTPAETKASRSSRNMTHTTAQKNDGLRQVLKEQFTALGEKFELGMDKALFTTMLLAANKGRIAKHGIDALRDEDKALGALGANVDDIKKECNKLYVTWKKKSKTKAKEAKEEQRLKDNHERLQAELEESKALIKARERRKAKAAADAKKACAAKNAAATEAAAAALRQQAADLKARQDMKEHNESSEDSDAQETTDNTAAQQRQKRRRAQRHEEARQAEVEHRKRPAAIAAEKAADAAKAAAAHDALSMAARAKQRTRRKAKADKECKRKAAAVAAVVNEERKVASLRRALVAKIGDTNFQLAWSARHAKGTLPAGIPNPPKEGATRNKWVCLVRTVATALYMHFTFTMLHNLSEQKSATSYWLTRIFVDLHERSKDTGKTICSFVEHLQAATMHGKNSGDKFALGAYNDPKRLWSFLEEHCNIGTIIGATSMVHTQMSCKQCGKKSERVSEPRCCMYTTCNKEGIEQLLNMPHEDKLNRSSTSLIVNDEYCVCVDHSDSDDAAVMKPSTLVKNVVIDAHPELLEMRNARGQDKAENDLRVQGKLAMETTFTVGGKLRHYDLVTVVATGHNHCWSYFARKTKEGKTRLHKLDDNSRTSCTVKDNCTPAFVETMQRYWTAAQYALRPQTRIDLTVGGQLREPSSIASATEDGDEAGTATAASAAAAAAAAAEEDESQ